VKKKKTVFRRGTVLQREARFPPLEWQGILGETNGGYAVKHQGKPGPMDGGKNIQKKNRIKRRAVSPL